MKSFSEAEFLTWAQTVGLSLDPQYPQSPVLRFEDVPGESRFWEIPSEPERRSYFFASILEATGGWQTCATWRALGSWPSPDRVEPKRINDVVEARLLAGLGLPVGTADVVQFERDETDTLLGVLFSTSVFGWSVGEDLHVIPNNGCCIIKVGHHGVVYVTLRDAADMDTWIAFLTERGFCLPDDVPDATFKRPGWMDPSGL